MAHGLKEPGYRQSIAEHGILVVEGINDVIGLDTIGVPAVGLCSNRMTEAQAEKLVHWSRLLAGGKVTLMLDCQPTGDEGAKETLWQLAQRGVNVRLAWSQAMHGGQFAGRQPESLSREEWETVIRPRRSRGDRRRNGMAFCGPLRGRRSGPATEQQTTHCHVSEVP